VESSVVVKGWSRAGVPLLVDDLRELIVRELILDPGALTGARWPVGEVLREALREGLREALSDVGALRKVDTWPRPA